MSKEHVFPISIGGAWTIDTVCEDCNKNLGKRIDQPFNRHKSIGCYRNVFNISNGKRSIPNPFIGKHCDEETGVKYEIRFEDSQLKAKPVPTFFPPKENSEGTFEGKIVMDVDMAKGEIDWGLAYLKKMKLDGNFKVVSQIVEQTPAKDLHFTFWESNDTLLPEFVKIAYETAATLVPAYFFDDPTAKIFRKYLQNLKMKERIRQKIGFRTGLENLLEQEIQQVRQIPIHHHLATLVQKKGKGLFCIVKIFHQVHAMQISEFDNYFSEDTVFVANDAVNGKYYIRMRVDFLKTTLHILFPNPDPCKAEKEESPQLHLPDSEKIPIYDCDGNELAPDIKEINTIPGVVTAFRLSPPNNLFYKTTWLPPIYIRDLNSNHLFQIGTLEFECLASYLSANPGIDQMNP